MRSGIRFLRWLHALGACIIIAIALIVGFDVFARLFFNSPFSGTSELTSVALVISLFMQLPYVIYERKLLRVEFFTLLLPKSIRRVLNTSAFLLGAILFFVMFVTSIGPTIAGLRSGEFFGTDAFRMPAWPLRVSVSALWLISTGVCCYLMFRYFDHDFDLKSRVDDEVA